MASGRTAMDAPTRTLGDMAPGLPGTDSPDRIQGDSITACQRSQRGALLALLTHGQDDRRGKLSIADGLPTCQSFWMKTAPVAVAPWQTLRMPGRPMVGTTLNPLRMCPTAMPFATRQSIGVQPPRATVAR